MSALNKKKLQAASTKNNPRATTPATTSTSHGKSTRNNKAKTLLAVAPDTGHGDADPDGILFGFGIQAKDRMVSVKKTAREAAFDDLAQEDDIQAATAFRKTAQKQKKKNVTNAEPTDPGPAVVPPKFKAGRGKKTNNVPSSIPVQPDNPGPRPKTPVRSTTGGRKPPPVIPPTTPNTRLSTRRQELPDTSVIDLDTPAQPLKIPVMATVQPNKKPKTAGKSKTVAKPKAAKGSSPQPIRVPTKGHQVEPGASRSNVRPSEKVCPPPFNF
jgi:hypothetical protein